MNENNEVRSTKRYKIMLVIALLIFPVLLGLSTAFWRYYDYSDIVQLGLWFLMICLTTFLVIQVHEVKLSPSIAVRFIVMSALGLAFLFFKPWLGLVPIEIYLSSDMFFLLPLNSYLSVICNALTIFLVAYISVMPQIKIQAINVVGFFLLALLSAVLGYILTMILLMSFEQHLTQSVETIIFIDVLLLQLASGITYYYVIHHLLKTNIETNSITQEWTA